MQFLRMMRIILIEIGQNYEMVTGYLKKGLNKSIFWSVRKRSTNQPGIIREFLNLSKLCN